MTFREYVEYVWVPNLRRRQVKPSTLKSYASMLEHHVYPAISSERLRDLTPPHIEMMLSNLQRYSAKYQRNVGLLLRAAFNHAVESGALDRSPMRDYHMPRITQKEKCAWSQEEVHKILDALPSQYVPLFHTIALTGMRLGEVLGMAWGQVDFRQGWIQVSQALWNGHVSLPKTDASIRVIPMGPKLHHILMQHKQSQTAVTDVWGREGMSGEPKPDEFVFRNQYGRPYQPDVLRRNVLYPVLYKLGFQWKDREGGFHRFRHSAGSIVVSKTGNLKHAQKLLGHSSITTTAHIYTHVSAEEIRKTVETLEEAILQEAE